MPERPARGRSRTAVDGRRTTLVLVFCRPDDLGVAPSRTRTTLLDCCRRPPDWDGCQEVENIGRRALEIREKALGPQNPDTLLLCWSTRARGEILGQAGSSGITRIGSYLTFLVL